MHTRAIRHPPASHPAHGCGWRCAARHRLALLIVGLASTVNPTLAQTDAASPAPVRVGFTRAMFRGVNENDARAALKAYVGILARDRGLTVEGDPLIFDGTADLGVSLRSAKVDVFVCPTDEMLAIPAELVTDPYLITVIGKTSGTEYLLLTHADSGLATLKDLTGRRVAVLHNVQGSLAKYWLDVLFRNGGLDVADAQVGELRFVAKPALAILPVFFRQLEACVVTRESLAVMTEMNPQVGRQVRILATSPRIVPAGTFFRRGFDSESKRKIVETASYMETNPTGRQVLAIFQMERVNARGDAELATTRQLLADHARLTALSNRATPAPPAGPNPPARP